MFAIGIQSAFRASIFSQAATITAPPMLSKLGSRDPSGERSRKQRGEAAGLDRRDRRSGGNAEDPLDEFDLTDNIPLGKPSDLSLSYRVHRLVASNGLQCSLHRTEP